jgi:AraC-like DNA-binding protein/mannose-6-phosphate isomerase-like protein (cupin superfamily)
MRQSKPFSDRGRYRSSRAVRVTREGKHVPEFSREFPFLIDCYHFDFDYHVTPNYHDYLEITYVYEGTGALRVGGARLEIRAGDLLVLGNTEVHWIETGEQKQLKVVALFFMPELIDVPGAGVDRFEFVRIFYERVRDSGNLVPADVIEKSCIPEAIQSIYEANLLRRKRYRLWTKVKLEEILLTLSDHYEETRPAGAPVDHGQRVAEFKRLQPFFAMVEDKYCERLTLREASRAANLSSGYFCRYFKRVTGVSFTEYLDRVRVDKAKELLMKNSFSVTDIALEVGFRSASHFHKVFREFTRLSPRQYVSTVRGAVPGPAAPKTSIGSTTRTRNRTRSCTEPGMLL